MTAASRDDETPSPELAPRRMLDGGAGEPERRLIASARLDRVPNAAKARVAMALGAVLEPAVAPGVEPRRSERAARAETLSRFGTRWGVGLVGAGILGAIALSLWLRAAPHDSDRASSMAPGPVPASSATPSGGAPSVATQPNLAAPVDPLASAEPAERAQPSELPEAAQLAQRTPPARDDRPALQRAKRQAEPRRAEPVDSGLLAEVRALEAVSTALAAGQPARAAGELQAYRRRFPRGELVIEADVLAVQIAVARGDHATARANAERLLARPEAEHYRARVRALLAGDELTPAAARENDRPERSNEAAAHIRARR